MNAKNDATRIAFGTVILAAGASRRMGRPKLLLAWNGTTILGHLMAQWHRAGAEQIGVVFDSQAGVIQEEMDRLKVPSHCRVPNGHPERGMFYSIQCAARWDRWLSRLTGWFVTLGDQPHLQDTTLRRLVQTVNAHPGAICQPSRNGHRRHPIFLPKALFLQLAESEASTLRDFLAQHEDRRLTLEIDDAGLDLDIDTPEDYAEARRLSSIQEP